jgi:subtilase family serine protease
MHMRIRQILAVLTPVAAASALAMVPMSTAAVTAAQHVAGRTGHMSPAVASPLAYRYAGFTKTPGVTFGCQVPGSSINCYAPGELATAYDIPANLTGAGRSIAIVDAFGDPTVAADLNLWDSVFGLPAANLNILYPNGQPAFDPNNADEVNWSGEIALDVESAHAVAPGATINLVIAKSDNDADILAAEQYAVDNNLGDVLSQSYGEAESCEDPSIRNADHALYAKAALKGISVFASSGDDGAAQPTCDFSSFIKSSSLPAGDPLVTAVGGTSLTATQPTGAYVSETAWNDEFGSSGGGFSGIFPRPLYQILDHATSPGRGVPDVSYSGDVNNGLLIAWSQGVAANVGEIWIFGGTSAGSPQWAAITALADQAGHHRLGFLNPALYAIAATPLYGYVFHDVTTGNNTVTVPDANGNPLTITGFDAGKGWDAVTGLGSPDVAHLINVLH